MRPLFLIYFIERHKFGLGAIYLLGSVLAVMYLPSAADYIRSKTTTPPNLASQGRVLAASTAGVTPPQAVTASQPAGLPHIPAFNAETLVQWPMAGKVTTEFGVPHWPWQRTHSGIDISSGLRYGNTPITPFRGGTVVKVVFQYVGLGNYVVVDHGDGITSYYAHMSSIIVQEGQNVKPGDILGYEGNTGASTGPHLHLEIRENGVPVNPRKYLQGAP